ncbi:hypothetical protein [Candidatus Sororendozoicomonas aggregata]|uniref:hypothetical protein n=1 Tax=Candidatus Sororendozoicomonas aggregata TaxID=3073239 RepID=UPI002ED2D7E3
MCIIKHIKQFILAFVGVGVAFLHSLAWAQTTLESYSALKGALERGEVPITGVIDFGQCTLKSRSAQKAHSFSGKEITVFNRNTVNKDGSILMLTTYKVNTQLMAQGKDVTRLPAIWIEWQSAYTLSKDDKQMSVSFIATDAKTGKTIKTADYLCPLGSAVKLWRTPHP